MITIQRGNGSEVFDPVKFPNGEIGFELYAHGNATVYWQYEGDHELVHLKMIRDHISGGILVIDYLPYSRMDRIKGEWAFTLKTVADMINSMDWGYVDIAEPHSDVSIALINNSRPFYPTRLIFDRVCEEIGFEKGKDYIVFPDAGAEKRYADMYTGHKYMVGYKKRDFDTGKITSFNLMDSLGFNEGAAGSKAIIVDDLCSYGGTFLATAEALERSYGIVDTTLLVAHLESKVHDGEMILSDLIKNVYATKSIYNPVNVWALRKHPKIHIYDWRT